MRGLPLAIAAAMKTLVVISWVFVCGCGTSSDSGPAPDPTVVFADACEPAACATSPVISDAAALVAQLEATPAWVPFGRYTSGCLAASDDQPVSGTITLDGGDVAIPASCQGCPEVGFVVRGQPAGVECLDPEQFFDFTLCHGIRFTDTTVRFRTIQMDLHPAVNAMAVVEVLAPCAAPCGASELACEASHTCWSTVRDHCAYCLAGSNDACACWDGDDFADDGTPCDRYTSGDIIEAGTCQRGVCVD